MDGYNNDNQEEIYFQIQRWEKHLSSGENIWFDSDDYVDIIDWYYEHGMDGKAEQVISEAFEYYPDNDEIISRKAGMSANNGDIDSAIAMLEDALSVCQTEKLKADLAGMYIDAGKNYDKAFEIISDLLKDNQDYFYYYFLMGRWYQENNKNPHAEKYFRKAIELNKEDKIIFGCYVDCACDKRLKKRMMSFLEQLAKDNPFNDLIWVSLGIVCYKYELNEKALTALNLAIAIKPEGEMRHSCKASCLISMNEFSGAKQELLLALQYSKGDRLDLYFLLSSVSMRLKQYRDALFYLEKITQIYDYSEDLDLLFNLALCYFALGEDSLAMGYVDRAFCVGDCGDEFVKFAYSLYDYGFYSACEEVLQRLIAESKDKSIIELGVVTLAAIQAQSGHLFEAVKLMSDTVYDLGSCSEDFWYAFLKLTCQDKKYDNFTTETLKLLLPLDSFPEYLASYLPEVLDNPNYQRCIKKIIHA